VDNISIKNRVLYPTGVLIQWHLNRINESGTFKTTISRSGGMAGPWEILAENLENTYAYVDKLNAINGVIKPNLLNEFKSIYYKIEVTTPSGKIIETIEETGPSVKGKMAGFQRKLVRDLLVQLKKFNGTRVAILKRKLWGEYCPKCFDKKTKEVVRSGCKTCWGTGFVGGYWTPMLSYARRAPGNASTAITPDQRSETSDVKIWTIDVPGLDVDDIFVFLEDNRRFRIDTTAQPEIQLTPTGQMFNAQEFNRDHIIYNLKVDTDTAYPLF
jgi:hypothetical protein